MEINDPCTVKMHYRLKIADGDELESSFEGAPLEFQYGVGQVIPGLERALAGMSAGDAKQVEVEPGDGYGERDPQKVANIPREQFPPNEKLEPGIVLGLQTEDGMVIQATVVSASESEVVIDLNHELAGMKLCFDVEIVEVSEARPQDQACGCGCGHDHGQAGRGPGDCGPGDCEPGDCC